MSPFTNTERAVAHQHCTPGGYLVSGRKIYPDRSIRIKKHGSGIWKPAGYATASSQASRLAIKNDPSQQPEYSPPLASITSQMNIIESTTTSGGKIQAPSPTTISLLKMQEFQNALDDIQSGSTFPDHLDFLDEQLAFDSSPLGYLDFTKNNSPVRDHKEAFIRLQTEIDSIQSHDDKFVRISREKAVHRIGQALHDLEEKVQRLLEEWRGGRPEELSVQESRPEKTPFEKPKPLVSEESSKSYLEPLHHVNRQPFPPNLTPDVCRLVGNDPRFHKVYMEMSSAITKVQMRRIDALSKDQSTDELDKALMVIGRNWEEFVHSLIIVKRNEEKSGYAMLEWKSDFDLDTGPDSDCDSHYLSLVLDPNDKEKSP
ncbi:hypothetical protein C0989_007849 [Termitomyces sp. Mn162]|nr:hypothetical protein C0989_007849 [Termitomyces sp. Mn162]